MMKNKNYNGLVISKTLMLLLFGSFALIFLVNSCASSEIAESEDVNQEKIYQAYWVTFDAGENSYYR